jgi:hypothetical protein
MAALVVAVVETAAGCAFDSPIMVQFSGSGPVTVKESLEPEQVPHRVHGVTIRAAQKIRIDCSTTIVYEIEEATGTTFLAQTFVVHLHTRALRRGTPYEVDCAGPVVVELPEDASGVHATSTSGDGVEVALPVQAPLASVPLAFGNRLRAEPAMALAVVGWPRTLPGGDYHAELAFDLPEARAFREKALVTASVSCGKSRYLQPILPAVTRIARVHALAIRPSANPIALPLPRIAGAIGSHAEASRTLSCRR